MTDISSMPLKVGNLIDTDVGVASYGAYTVKDAHAAPRKPSPSAPGDDPPEDIPMLAQTLPAATMATEVWILMFFVFCLVFKAGANPFPTRRGRTPF